MLIHESMLKCKQYVVSAIPNQRNFLDRVLIGTLMACLLLPSLVWAQEDETDDWPREITVSEGVVVIYQPQPEKLDGDQLKVRAAVAVKFKGASEPVFGAVWLEARLETDRAERTATIVDVSVTRVRFPEQDEAKSQKLRALLEKEIPKWQLPISLDRLSLRLQLQQRSISLYHRRWALVSRRLVGPGALPGVSARVPSWLPQRSQCRLSGRLPHGPSQRRAAEPVSEPAQSGADHKPLCHCRQARPGQSNEQT